MFCRPCGGQVLRFSSLYGRDPETDELSDDYGAISAVFDQNRIRRATRRRMQDIYRSGANHDMDTGHDYVDQLKNEISHASCKLDAVIEMFLIMKLSREQLEKGNLVASTKSGMNFRIAMEMGATIGLFDYGPSRGGHLDYATYYAFWTSTRSDPSPFTLAHWLISRRCQDPKFDPTSDYVRSPLNDEDEPLYDELRTAAAVIELGSIKERALFRWL